MNYNYPNLTFVKDRRKRFELLDAGGWLDFSSGAWDRGRNVRRAKCGRSTTPIAAGQGSACNEFLSDGYRTVTRYLCPRCEAGYAATRREFASLPIRTTLPNPLPDLRSLDPAAFERQRSHESPLERLTMLSG